MPQKRIQGKATTIATIARKGGEKKTTTSTHLAAGLALRGYATLLIEADDNARAYDILIGGESRDDLERGLARSAYALFHPDKFMVTDAAWTIDMKNTMQRSHLSKENIQKICETRGWQNMQSLDMIPGGAAIRDIEAEFAVQSYIEQQKSSKSGQKSTFIPSIKLDESLQKLKYDYDFIIIDTPPSLTEVIKNAITASDYVYIPVGLDHCSIKDYQETYATFLDVKSTCMRMKRIPPEILGVVVTCYDHNNMQHIEIVNRYFNVHINPRTGKNCEPEIALQPLAILPFDMYAIGRAQESFMTMHTFAPMSNLGVAMHTFVQNIEQIIRESHGGTI